MPPLADLVKYPPFAGKREGEPTTPPPCLSAFSLRIAPEPSTRRTCGTNEIRSLIDHSERNDCG